MASNASAISLEDIRAAVDSDPTLRRCSPERVEAYKALAALLPPAVGDHRLDDVVTFKEYLAVQLNFLIAVLSALDDGKSGIPDDLLDSCDMNAEIIEDSLEGYNDLYGRANPLDLISAIGLTDELTTLAIAGLLTYRDILLKQPMVMIPQPQE